ncbi:hypothetical protein [Natrinema salifodinae]|uniref:Uncharacterized protein n=1 Tax=Natrinema salifodinae TaxID=1202768 RepID=A0A1I0P7Y8_9EURY|nr:hypothetical protein [Natrinema salifodinae]SEW10198.1 hypothetical protein SAMN05216285_2235 [Natrinema salifodinae]
MADNEIRWALWDAFEHIYQVSQDYDTSYSAIRIILHDDVNVELDDSGDASDFYDNSDGVLEQWHDNFEDYTDADKGNHLLLDERHEYSDAARVTEIGSDYEPAFEQRRSAVIGVGGNPEIARGLAVMEALHNLIDSESVSEVQDMIDSGGHMHEHDLGTLQFGPDYDGEVTPMACLYTGGEGSEVWEKYNEGRDVTYHVEHGQCSVDRDYWNGEYTVIPSECTIDAVKYTRDALYSL